jgi:uncharacterized protein YjbJ (UPF0337 family)
VGSVFQEETMVNKNQVKGAVEHAKGKVKEVAGKVFGDKKMQAKGNVEKNMGKVQSAVGNTQQSVNNAAHKSDQH